MKAKFLELILALNTSMGELKSKVNTVIAGLPPVEQHEAASMVMGLTRELGWVVKDIERAADSTSVAKVDEMLSSFQAEVIQAAIADKKVVPVEEVALRIEAAENAIRAQVTEEFNVLAKKKETIIARRATIVADLGEVIAAQFTDDMIVAESFDADFARAKSAVDRIKENGIEPDKSPKAHAFVSAAVLKPAAEFDAALELATEAASKAVTPATPVAGVTVHASAAKPENPGSTESKLPKLVKAY